MIRQNLSSKSLSCVTAVKSHVMRLVRNAKVGSINVPSLLLLSSQSPLNYLYCAAFLHVTEIIAVHDKHYSCGS